MSEEKKVGQPCPICHKIIFILGKTKKGETIASCGHKYKFKKSRSQKEMDRKYIKTEDGWELK